MHLHAGIRRAVGEKRARLQPAQLGLEHPLVVVIGDREALFGDLQRRARVGAEQQGRAEQNE